MSCPINLFDSLTGSPDNTGAWYLVEVVDDPPGIYLDLLDLSSNGTTFYTTSIDVLDRVENVAQSIEGHNIWVDAGALPEIESIKFAYVVPDPGEDTYNPNWVNEDCFDVAFITLTDIDPPSPPDVERCNQESIPSNLFTDAGISSNDYEILSCADAGGSGGCSDFNLSTGDYNPLGIPVDTYTFTFKHLNTPVVCDEAEFTMNVIITGGVDAGNDQAALTCNVIGV